MDWDFFERNPAGDANTASQARIIIEGDHSISPLEIFVREVLQNSLDAAREVNGSPQKVTVRFKLHTVHQPRSKEAFLSAIGWPTLKRRVSAANHVRVEDRREPAEFGNPDALEHADIIMLEISETGTIGLVGPERIEGERGWQRLHGQPPKAYLALTREDATREKLGLGSGGTFGLGKAVLWAASDIQTVFFFSRLSEPANATKFRAAGQSRLGLHYVDGLWYRGLGYGGKLRDQGGHRWSAPLTNEQAQEFASKISVGVRPQPEDAGTTILIPFWRQPESDMEERLPTHTLLAKYAARYFWPAMEDSRLEVVAESDRGQRENATDHMVHYQPFIELYGRVRQNMRGQRDAPVQDIHFAVPAGPPPRIDPGAQTFVRAGMCLLAREDEVRSDFCRKVACIRGLGMVVGYERMTGHTLVKPFVGLALAGRVGDPSPNGIRGDVLLGFAEHVTHTKWEERNNQNFRYWTHARPVVRNLLQELRNYFETHSRLETVEAPSDLTPLEEGLRFPGEGRGPVPPPPPRGGVPELRTQQFHCVGNKYEFEVRARVEAGNKPFFVDIWVEAGMETRHTQAADRFSLTNLHTVPPNLEIDLRPDGKARVVIPTRPADTWIRISGETEPIPADLLPVSVGLLNAKSVRPDQHETPDTEAVGVDEHAES
jgi:hypothetical protein